MALSRENLSLYSLAKRRPYALVVMAGLLLAASFPPSPLNFLIFIAFVPLMVLLEHGVVPDRVIEGRVFLPFKWLGLVIWRAVTFQFIWRRPMLGHKVLRYESHEISGNAQLFRYSYAAFLIWNVLCCYWLLFTVLGAANLVEAIPGFIAGMLALLINPILMSVPIQFQTRLRRYISPELAVLCLILFWIAFEYLHLHWELSWPWLTLGNALSYHPAWIQYAEFTGVLGISLHILLGNFFVYVGQRWLRKNLSIALISFATALLLILGPRLLNGPLTAPERAAFQSTGTLQVRMLQPNIDPYASQDKLSPEEQVSLFCKLMVERPLAPCSIVLLPEIAISKPLNVSGLLKSRLLLPLWGLVDSLQIDLLTGLEDFENFSDTLIPPLGARESYRIVQGKRQLVYSVHHNSAWFMRPDRDLTIYNKGKLVPMVERVPFLKGMSLLKPLGIDLVKGINNFGRPDSLACLYTQDGVATNVMICYESAFGDHTRRKTALGASWIAMITNDGWWGNSAGYQQHAGLSIIRAIENRRSVARCANNGRSMFIDAKGEASQVSAWWTTSVLDAQVPLYDYQTFYVRHGDYIGQIALGLSLLIILAGWVPRIRAILQRRALPDIDEEGLA